MANLQGQDSLLPVAGFSDSANPNTRAKSRSRGESRNWEIRRRVGPSARQIPAEVGSRGRFALLSFAASRLGVLFLQRGSGRGEPDPGIDPVARELWVILKLVKIFSCTRRLGLAFYPWTGPTRPS